jgi:hypothetical protein
MMKSVSVETPEVPVIEPAPSVVIAPLSKLAVPVTTAFPLMFTLVAVKSMSFGFQVPAVIAIFVSSVDIV